MEIMVSSLKEVQEVQSLSAKDISEKRKKDLNNSIGEVIQAFEEINPTISYANKTIRKSAEKLILLMGKEKVIETIKYAISIQGKEFSPTITTPYELDTKLPKLRLYWLRTNKKSKTSNYD